MKKVYINSIASISPQKTYDNSRFLDEIINYNDTVIFAQDPDYKQYIPPAAARRMAKGIKMGVVASKIAPRSTICHHFFENVDFAKINKSHWKTKLIF